MLLPPDQSPAAVFSFQRKSPSSGRVFSRQEAFITQESFLRKMKNRSKATEPDIIPE